jgi:hypothetical protein
MMPSAYRKMLGHDHFTNWTIIDIWRPPRGGAAHLTEQLFSIRTARSSLTQSSSDPSRFAALRKVDASREPTQWLDKSDSLIERGGTLRAPRFRASWFFPVVAKFRADCPCKAPRLWD